MISSIILATGTGISFVLSYGIGLVERTLKQRFGIAELLPRLGFWLSVCRWLGMLFVASAAHSQVSFNFDNARLSPPQFVTIGLIGGALIAGVRFLLMRRWQSKPRHSIGLRMRSTWWFGASLRV